MGEISINVIVGKVAPIKFDPKELGYLTHKINVGEGLHFMFKCQFSFTIWAKVNKFVNIKCKVEIEVIYTIRLTFK